MVWPSWRKGRSADGPQFGPPRYATPLLHLGCLATLLLGGSGPLAVDSWIANPLPEAMTEETFPAFGELP